MVVLHVEATCGCRDVQLMGGNVEATTRCGERAVELVTGICHAVLGKGGFQTTFIKWPVMGDKRKTFYQRLDLRPYFRERRLPVSVPASEAVDFGCPICIIIGYGLNERVKFIDNLTAPHHYNANAAYA